MVIVSDTTTLGNLFMIQKLWILEKLYGNVIIPEAVLYELEKLKLNKLNISQITDSTWIKIRPVMNESLVAILSESLDRGESEAIVLAQELRADLLIIDEIKGRNYAKKLNIRIIGLVGILVQAKIEGILENVGEILDELKHKAGFWISQELYDKAIVMSNEKLL